MLFIHLFNQYFLGTRTRIQTEAELTWVLASRAWLKLVRVEKLINRELRYYVKYPTLRVSEDYGTAERALT